MTDLQPPEIDTNLKPKDTSFRVSTNPLIQNQVINERTSLQKKYKHSPLDILNQWARDRVAAAFRIARNKREVKTAQEESMVDPLTGLYNRRWLDQELDRRIAEAERTDKDLWVMYIDIDDFKKINDRYGHSGGDEVLKLIKQLQVRKEEPLTRLSGGAEEIVQLLDENITRDEIATVVARHKKKMEDLSKKLFHELEQKNDYLKGNPIPIDKVTMSFGITKYIRGETKEELIGKADKAMYHAKSNGKNCGYIAEVKNDKIEYELLPSVKIGEEAAYV